MTVEELKRKYFENYDTLLAKTLEECNYNRTKAAKKLGIQRQILVLWIRSTYPDWLKRYNKFPITHCNFGKDFMKRARISRRGVRNEDGTAKKIIKETKDD